MELQFIKLKSVTSNMIHVLESQIKLEQLNVYSDIEWKWEKPFY